MTYHALADKGALSTQLSAEQSFSGAINVTEKIDGTNSRIIFFNDDYLIGSREELLYAKGDRIGNPALNIVTTIKPFAEQLSPLLPKDQVCVLYGETYGGVVTAASKHYTDDKTLHFRVFDLSMMPLTDAEAILSLDISKISQWREDSGQYFVNTDALNNFAQTHSLPIVPSLMQLDGAKLPTDLQGTFDWLAQFKNTRAGINFSGMAEGVIVRDHNRRLIRKIRFEDYNRTKKRNIF